MPKFVIEHLEPNVFPWCKLEYKHISKWVGKRNLIFTNTKSSSLKSFGKVMSKSVRQLRFDKACVLDPEAKQTLTSDIAKKYDYFVFGGILGDNPPKKRTKAELTRFLPYPAYNLGKEQMSTDTAVIVTKMICNGKKLRDLKFQQGIEISISDYEEVHLPYKYLVIKGRPLLAPGISDMLKRQRSF
ncbi:MAG: SAM-dependent methyltransferase [Candidatus Woesearchaeota archaeon]